MINFENKQCRTIIKLFEDKTNIISTKLTSKTISYDWDVVIGIKDTNDIPEQTVLMCTKSEEHIKHIQKLLKDNLKLN
jgi:nitrogen regulatory protein PII-like uncharacterized protein